MMSVRSFSCSVNFIFDPSTILWLSVCKREVQMRRIIRHAMAAIGLFAFASAASAEDWTPPGPIKFLIAFAAGGGADTSLNNGDVATNLDLTTPVDVAVDRNDVVSFTHREGPIGSTGVFRIDPVNGQITQLAGGGTDIGGDEGGLRGTARGRAVARL